MCCHGYSYIAIFNTLGCHGTVDSFFFFLEVMTFFFYEGSDRVPVKISIFFFFFFESYKNAGRQSGGKKSYLYKRDKELQCVNDKKAGHCHISL